MDPQTQQRISETVTEILKASDMDKVTEYIIRNSASEKLGMDLSGPAQKRLVREVVEAFLSKAQPQEEPQNEAQDEDEDDPNKPQKDDDDSDDGDGDGDGELDDEGNPIICRLSSKRRVTISDFKGKTLVSIREYYNKGTKELPTAKGISLTTEQWAAFRKNVPAIEKAIKKMESRLD